MFFMTSFERFILGLLEGGLYFTNSYIHKPFIFAKRSFEVHLNPQFYSYKHP